MWRAVHYSYFHLLSHFLTGSAINTEFCVNSSNTAIRYFNANIALSPVDYLRLSGVYYERTYLFSRRTFRVGLFAGTFSRCFLSFIHKGSDWCFSKNKCINYWYNDPDTGQYFPVSNLNFGIQLLVDLLSAGFVDKIGYRVSIMSAPKALKNKVENNTTPTCPQQ